MSELLRVCIVLGLWDEPSACSGSDGPCMRLSRMVHSTGKSSVREVGRALFVRACLVQLEDKDMSTVWDILCSLLQGEMHYGKICHIDC